jgi:hypothetical protein
MTKKSTQLKDEDVKKQITFELGVVRITNLGFSLNESIELPPMVDLSYGLKIGINISEELIDIVLGTIYRTKAGELPFLTSNASTTFILKDITKYSSKDNPQDVTLPDPILHTCFSVAFSHARAIQSINTSGTKFSSLVLPLINPTELFNTLMEASGAKRVNSI